MTFTLHVEHEVIGGETVLETFEGVVSFNDPPMTSSLHLTFADENRDDEQLDYGNVVRAEDEPNND
jgi:hypothetical protein